jgi:hypothetical protein
VVVDVRKFSVTHPENFASLTGVLSHNAVHHKRRNNDAASPWSRRSAEQLALASLPSAAASVNVLEISHVSTLPLRDADAKTTLFIYLAFSLF